MYGMTLRGARYFVHSVEGLFYTQSTRVSVPSSELGPPPAALTPQASVPPPWNQRGGKATVACGLGVGGTQFGRLERKHGTLYNLWCATCLIVSLHNPATPKNWQDNATQGVPSSFPFWFRIQLRDFSILHSAQAARVKCSFNDTLLWGRECKDSLTQGRK